MRYEAELARRRYMKVDSDNRLVPDTLEAEWNDKLRRHADAAEDYERRRKQQAQTLSTEARRRILDLAEQLSRIWQDACVEPRGRKRIVRLLIDDVTLISGQWEIPSGKTILKGHGGYRGRSARLIPTVPSPV